VRERVLSERVRLTAGCLAKRSVYTLTEQHNQAFSASEGRTQACRPRLKRLPASHQPLALPPLLSPMRAPRLSCLA
jgi:hypothetical protein